MPSQSEDVALSIRDLTKRFGEVVAVRHLSLDVHRGEIIGLLGPNGAGKTTTIGAVCGMVRPDAGTIVIDGRPAAGRRRECNRLLGLCPQDLVIWESLTCSEQLELVARLYDMSAAQARRSARELLGVLGLAERRHRLAKTLSGGMKRRLNIALALVHQPRLLILDEPQAGLDPQSRVLVREYLRSLVPDVTVVVTTHDMDEADRLADRIAIVDRGRLLELDTADGLKRRIGEGDVLELTVAQPGLEPDALRPHLPDGVRYLGIRRDTLRLVGTDILAALPAVLDAVRHCGPVQDIMIRPKTLEDVFIELTGRGLRE